MNKNVRRFERWNEILTSAAAKDFTDAQFKRAFYAMGKCFVASSNKEKVALTLVFPQAVKQIISNFYTFKIEAGDLS